MRDIGKADRMELVSGPNASAREPTLSGLLFPFGILLVLLFATGMGLTWFAAKGQDDLASENTRQLIHSVLNTYQQNLAQTTKEYAYWNEMIANVVTTFDADYIKRESEYLAENFGITSVHVIDAEGRSVYAWIDGARAADNPLEDFSKGVWSIIARARDSANDAIPIPVAGFAGDGKAVYLVGASEMADYDVAVDARIVRGTDWVLVLTRRMDAHFLTKIANDFQVDGLRLVTPDAIEPHSGGLSLSEKDDVLGHLVWEAERPGRDLIIGLLPVLGLTMALGVGFSAVFFRRGRDVVRRIKERTESLTRELGERQRAEAALSESEERFRKVAQSAREAIISVDSRARIVFWNDGAKTMFGYTADEIYEKSFFMLAPERHRADHRDRFAKVCLGDPAGLIGNTVEGRGLRKDTSEFPIETSYSEWILGGATYYTAIIRDVTARKLAEKELRLAKESADRANRAKSDFLSSMSHELRTPLNGILGFAQLLDLGGDTPLDEEQKQFVGHITRSGRHLLSLISDILDLSKIDAGKIDLVLEDVPIEAALAECVELVELDARARGIEISIPEAASVPLLVHADATRVRQALLNLLSNAVKYNNDGGRVAVTFAAPANGMLRVIVADTGRGIAEARRGEVFQPFSRLGAEQSKIEGTGIGLTVTKRIVEKMGGRIGFESEVGIGSTFWIELPVAGD